MIPSKSGSAFCALCPKTVEAFKTPSWGTKATTSGKRKRNLPVEEKSEDVVGPKVARVTRSTSKKNPQEEEKLVEIRTRRARVNGKMATVQKVDIDEQERRDFELAKKLQCELNRTARSRNSTASASSGYSLRSKRKSVERNTDPPVRRTTRRVKKTN